MPPSDNDAALKNLLEKTGQLLYGISWKTALARDLELNGPRRINEWLYDQRPMPPLEGELLALLQQRADALNRFLAQQKKLTSSSTSPS